LAGVNLNSTTAKQLRIVAGSLFGILPDRVAVLFLFRFRGGRSFWLVASAGASAVLVMPAGPMSQPPGWWWV
jgi:CBS-domain-containing membrane protein